ncbi:hypothetical protein GDO81_002719 [Engystomops pustulosus]|uniref:Splicing regulatory glutamine/lysine-rich protein 1 n=1 Tax=Engystomops pustulosus TaxID=76066 RepID=A0AAV7DMH1_ENGPU|nr:hypothetical protein GDO81_002719 [Engystomops pustulosus]KAG8598734.1 hypothetical protein GDO81_002719 [Engystomops pustulosus]
MSSGKTAVIQVTNLSAAVTSDQMRTLFSFLGDVEELRLYPPDNAPLAFSSKVCYIKFRDPSSVGVSQHLTNTVFIDRALIVVPCAEGRIPEEAKALSLLAPAPTLSSLLPGAGLLPIPTPAPSPLASVLRREKVEVPLLSVPFTALAATLPAPLEPVLPALAPVLPALAPVITSLADLQQPPLIGNVDPTKVDEIRRTIYVGNLNSQTTTAEQLLEFFKQVGDVRFVRMAGDETQPTRFAFVEFSDQNSVTRALTFNGVMFGDRPLKINHSNNAIVKPPELTPQAAAKELEEVMKRVREAQSLISEAIEPETGKPAEKTQTLPRTRSHSRSKSRSRWKRSRSKHRSRSRNRSRSRHKERRSPHKKRSRSRERRKSKSRSRERKRDKDRSKAKEKERPKEKIDRRKKEKPSRSPSKGLSSARKSRSISRERRKRRSRSLSKSPRSSKFVKRLSRSPSPRRKEKKRGKERDESGDRRESERFSSKKNSNKDKEMRESFDKYKIREKDNMRDDLVTVNEIAEDDIEDDRGSRHNGNCTLTEYSKSRRTEVA